MFDFDLFDDLLLLYLFLKWFNLLLSWFHGFGLSYIWLGIHFFGRCSAQHQSTEALACAFAGDLDAAATFQLLAICAGDEALDILAELAADTLTLILVLSLLSDHVADLSAAFQRLDIA